MVFSGLMNAFYFDHSFFDYQKVQPALLVIFLYPDQKCSAKACNVESETVSLHCPFIVYECQLTRQKCSSTIRMKLGTATGLEWGNN